MGAKRKRYTGKKDKRRNKHFRREKIEEREKKMNLKSLLTKVPEAMKLSHNSPRGISTGTFFVQLFSTLFNDQSHDALKFNPRRWETL